VAVHNIILGTGALASESRCIDRIIREAVEIKIYPNNINGEDGFCLSKTLKPLVRTPKEEKKPLSKNKTCTSFCLGHPLFQP
jgi:hypothetical protein